MAEILSKDGRLKLRQLLIKHEGLRLNEYVDTENKITIGVGHNLTDRGQANDPVYRNGITRDKALSDLDSDINYFLNKLSQYGWFMKLNEPRKIAILDMSFMGVQKIVDPIHGFKDMISAIQNNDYESAANEILNSKWSNDVKQIRANDVATIMRTGQMN